MWTESHYSLEGSTTALQGQFYHITDEYKFIRTFIEITVKKQLWSNKHFFFIIIIILDK